LLHGGWKGGACRGDWTFGADGTFELRHYSPGNNTITGTWEVRWNSLPPTMALTCKTSDAQDRFPVGKAFEVKLVQLDGETLAYHYPDGQPLRCTRSPGVLAREAIPGSELAALQGTLVPLHYEEGGKKVRAGSTPGTS
jgi:hypothetical protein